MASSNETVIRFSGVYFEYGLNKVILDDVDFSVRKGMKMTIMGQNGAGKTSIFNMIMGDLKPRYGTINIDKGLKIAISRQIMTAEDKTLTIQAFFRKYFADDSVFNIDRKISEVLQIVNLKAGLERIVGSFSGGQQARLLLASALIQNPDILLLDEPTNNLDTAGIEHLTTFLQAYKNTVLVISHDAEFLNSFTHGVLYLDVHTKKIEQYVGDYHDVVERIKAQIEQENMKNARLAKVAQENKDQANVFAHKGGKLRLVAKKMREKAEELEENMVDVRKEDRTIKPFQIPLQDDVGGKILEITSYTVIDNGTPETKETHISLTKGKHLLISGPNGIGKTTLLESLANKTAPGAKIGEKVRVGYYRQDFSTLNFDETVYDCLARAMQDGGGGTEHHMR